jgi:hypothetical protein
MNLFKTISGVMKPKWQHYDHKIRMNAVAAMSERDALTLETIVLTDSDEGIQIAACKKINDSKLLLNIIAQHDKLKLRNLAQKKYDRLVYGKIIKSTINENSREWLRSVQDQKVLADIVINAKCDELRTAAFVRISNEEIFYRIAIAENCPGKLAKLTIAAFSEPKLLNSLTGKKISKAVKKLAKQRLEELFPPEEDLEFKQQQLELKLNNMTKYAESVCQTADNIEGIERILADDKKRWLTLDPDYAHPLAQRFLAALERFAEHYATVAAKKAAERLEQAEQRKLYEHHEQLISQLQHINAQQDDALKQLAALKQQWLELANSDTEIATNTIAEQFMQGCRQLEADICTVTQEKEQLKQLLADCEHAETLFKTANITAMQKYSTPKWGRGQFKFIDPTAELERFNQSTVNIQKAIEQFNQATATKAKEHLERLETLLGSLRSIIDLEDRRQAAKELRKIKDEWQTLAGNKSSALAQQFQKLKAEFNIKQQQFIEECKWNEWANKDIKLKLIKTVEQTADIPDLEQVAVIIRNAQKSWKSCGSASRSVDDELWQRFHQACEKNYSRCLELFEQKKQTRIANFDYCKKLCKQAEQLCDSSDFSATVKQFKSLQRDWKTHSDLPKEAGHELYKQFRGFADKFFARLNLHYGEIDAQREENQVAKAQLIAQVEALCEQKRHIPADCIALQKKWQQLGPGNRELEPDNIQQFRAACDSFFALVEAEREKIIPQKEQICTQLEVLLAEIDNCSHEQLITAVTDLQKKWQQLGPLPKKSGSELKSRFQTLCEQLLGIERQTGDDAKNFRLENLELKQALLEQAEQLASSTEWKVGAIKLKELQAKWNIIGPVPKEYDRELWQNFRNSCNDFFNRRKEYFATMDSQRLDNFKNKEVLIARLENITASLDKTANSSLQNSEMKLSLAEQIQLSVENNFAVAELDGRGLAAEVKRIQQEWKNIGPVPREYDKALWEKYHNLLDCFYQAGKM